MASHASAQRFQSADKQASLIELYSSEGCSSCPPAEEHIGRWKNSPGIWKQFVPVVFHVDYWDQLGWPDRFAKPEYTQRQRDYAAQLGQDSVYTPEYLLNGHEWRTWFLQQDPPAASGQTVGVLNISAEDAGRQITATFTPAAKSPGGQYHLQVALLGSNLVSNVQRGENGGRTLRHEFVALSFLSIPMSAGESGLAGAAGRMPAPGTPDKPAAIAAWVTSDSGAFLQATGGWLASSGQPSVENAAR